MNIYLDLGKFPLPVLPAMLNGFVPLIIPLQPQFGNRLNRITRVQFDESATRVTEIVLAMYHEIHNRNQGFEESIAALFKHFLILTCREFYKSGMKASLSAGQSTPPVMEGLRKHLDSHFDTAIRLSDLASNYGLEPTYLCRCFKKYTGKSIFEYLLDRRIQAAMMSLRATDRKIAAIAMACGFNDLAHFNRAFKQRNDRTPREYRQYR